MQPPLIRSRYYVRNAKRDVCDSRPKIPYWWRWPLIRFPEYNNNTRSWSRIINVFIFSCPLLAHCSKNRIDWTIIDWTQTLSRQSRMHNYKQRTTWSRKSLYELHISYDLKNEAVKSLNVSPIKPTGVKIYLNVLKLAAVAHPSWTSLRSFMKHSCLSLPIRYEVRRRWRVVSYCSGVSS